MRYELKLDRFRLSAGPSLDVLVRPVVVTLSGQELVRIPTIVPALSIEATYEP